MEAQPRTGSSSSSVAYPRWVMFEELLEIKVDSSFSCSLTDDAKTLAAARTSRGHPIQVSLRLAEPPAPSRVCLQIPDGVEVEEEKSKVLAAHGDSVLIQVCIEDKNQRTFRAEYFVYNAGTPAVEPETPREPRPPSLSLLPPYYVKALFSDALVSRDLCDDATGLLRRGDDDLVVAELSGWSFSDDPPRVGELCVFRSGEWKYHEFEIREAWDLSARWHTVVPVDDRRLCWVDVNSGVMLIDVFEEPPSVQYVRLPMDPHDYDSRRSNRNVCITAGGTKLKFVNIFGRCCCGAAASCDCEGSRHAYTIHTWTMRVDSGGGDAMEWVKDGMVDATELWALNVYKGLPCDPLDRPVVSLDQPEVIFFRLRGTNDRRTLWQIMVNMKSKTIHSISRHEDVFGNCYPCTTRDKLIPSGVSYFFNTLTGQVQVEDERPPDVVVDEQQLIITRDDDSFAELASVQGLIKMFEALQEIPSYGLGSDEVKAYRILNSDNGHRLKSLLSLPKDLRKDWLLMEITGSDALINPSALCALEARHKNASHPMA